MPERSGKLPGGLGMLPEAFGQVATVQFLVVSWLGERPYPIILLPWLSL
ncbi:MAG: hypothetical protein H6662_04525 [Ardenticatenaceae bacterium]|nr:hypothetical protein [Ardenticatenaceae bacterium]MCB8991654.1 hypothetical protein [Ardenticatenaceae bacterium]MCB9002752.1 hypothetical protein [Ardenticatenaceae bacterium]